MRVEEAFRVQADACRQLGSAMYGELLDRLVEDWLGAGPIREVLRGHEDDPGPSALALRLLGSVHRLVLEGEAGGLAAYYPSAGGTWQPEAGWHELRRLLAERPEAVRAWLDRPPQTNEVGRAAALYGGLLHLPGDLPVRLFELGSSGGLNLRADGFTYVDGHGTRFGSPSGVLVLQPAWLGRRLDPRPVRVVERLGCDPLPVDVSTAEGRLTLAAYVWPDMTERFERLRSALEVARRVPATVLQEDALAFLQRVDLREGTVTVLWHSVMWQYLSPEDRAHASSRIDRLGARATQHAPFAHLLMEPTRRSPDADHEFLVVLRTWPGGDRRVLGVAAPHGVPVRWE